MTAPRYVATVEILERARNRSRQTRSSGAVLVAALLPLALGVAVLILAGELS